MTKQINKGISWESFSIVGNKFIRSKELTPQEKMCWLIIWSYNNADNGCFPGQERLAEDMGVTTRYVRKILSSLRKKGFLGWEKRGLGLTNVYSIYLPDEYS